MNLSKKIKKAILLSGHFINQPKLKKQSSQYQNSILSMVVDTIEQVKKDKFTEKDQEIFDSINLYRSKLSTSDETVDYEIFEPGKVDTVKAVFQRASSPEIWCKFHYALAKNFQAKQYLEIGTNLGVSGSFILQALKNQSDFQFITLEGIPDLVKIATRQFQTITNESHFQIVEGLYQNTFAPTINQLMDLDMAFIDGNHRYEPTLYYFEEIKKKLNSKAIVVFDDIYTSEEMIKLWKKVQEDSDVNYFVDLHKLGLAIIDKSDTNKKVCFKAYLSR